jgi:hypothetical protein
MSLQERRSSSSHRKIGIVVFLVLLLNCASATLDFLDPFLKISPEEQQQVDHSSDEAILNSNGGSSSGIGASGSLAASGHVDALGFGADGSLAASKSIGLGGVGSGLDKSVGFEGDQQQQPQFPVEQRPTGQFIPNMRPPQQQRPLNRGPSRITIPVPVPKKEPCNHPMPGQFYPPAPPLNQKDAPILQKHLRSINKDDKMKNASTILTNTLSPQNTSKSHHLHANETALHPVKALRLARSILDKAILQKSKNSTTNTNSTKIDASKSTRQANGNVNDPNADFDFEPVDVDKDGSIDQDDEDFLNLRHARAVLDQAIKSKNGSKKHDDDDKDDDDDGDDDDDKKKHKRSANSVPVLVVEQVKFIPLPGLDLINTTNTTDPSQSLIHPLVSRSSETNLSSSSSSDKNHQNSTTMVNSTNKDDRDDRAISPNLAGIANMFHHMIAG